MKIDYRNIKRDRQQSQRNRVHIYIYINRDLLSRVDMCLEVRLKV